jgi:cell division protein FtsB
LGLRTKILFLLGLALALGLILYTLLGPGSGGKRAHMQAELTRLQLENQGLREKNRTLTLQIDALKKRRDYLEKVARDELGLVKKDELLLRFPEEPDGGSPVKAP